MTETLLKKMDSLEFGKWISFDWAGSKVRGRLVGRNLQTFRLENKRLFKRINSEGVATILRDEVESPDCRLIGE